MGAISRRQMVGGGTAAAAAMVVGAPSVHAQKDRQTLRFVAQADLKVLDPVWTTAYITRNHSYLVYDTLFGLHACGGADQRGRRFRSLQIRERRVATWRAGRIRSQCRLHPAQREIERINWRQESVRR